MPPEIGGTQLTMAQQMPLRRKFKFPIRAKNRDLLHRRGDEMAGTRHSTELGPPFAPGRDVIRDAKAGVAPSARATPSARGRSTAGPPVPLGSIVGSR